MYRSMAASKVSSVNSRSGCAAAAHSTLLNQLAMNGPFVRYTSFGEILAGTEIPGRVWRWECEMYLFLPIAVLSSPHSEFRSCVKVEVAVLGSKSLIVSTVSVDVKQH